MTTSPKVFAVVPAHNEARTVQAVAASLRPLVSEVVVVDDASTDATGERARQAGAVVVRNDTAQGYDGALNRGFEEAAHRGADIFLTFDADGEHDAADVPRVLEQLLAGSADVVVGERPHVRHAGEWLFALYTWLRFGIRDPLCGLKAYRREVYERAGVFDSKRSIGTELMLRAARSGFRLARVPITLHQRVHDASRFYASRLRGTGRILTALVRVAFM